ncbi:class I SAM-dependent methyltransferase [Falsarthrobacter nasiphocae]|uniref:Ubiquinone/menaquinone biosynthesis C-methylase UbiE n=1 Tax=Falsarthrobacter nasiphocae TaxID=189863 RepID=A0AAE3YDZ9_9MICC|nr:class I SAM-dependent methyltransferase [Falsarthrobacter nasiphocae]MDR6891435.1 ubiquinone/menaquinone biosynthesis C-methylase UbiE [Falsarthrobacter nasiphocae]
MPTRDIDPRPPYGSSGAESFESLAPSVWNPLGSALTSAADLVPGEQVLDLFAGTGGVSLPAAQEVGPEGTVTAVDPSAALLALAAEKARTLNLRNLHTVHADAASFEPETAPDAVLLGLAMTRVADLTGFLGGIRGCLAPGGRLALSTWSGPELRGLLTPLLTVAQRHNRALEQGPLPGAFERLERFDTPLRLREDLSEAGFGEIESGEIHLKMSLDRELLWDLVLGTSLRRVLTTDDAEANRRIRSEYLDAVLAPGFADFSATAEVHVARP